MGAAALATPLGLGGGAGEQGGGHRQLWPRPDLGAEWVSARPARHSPSPPPTCPPGPEHGWAISQRGWLGHGCARQTRTGGRVFQGGRPAGHRVSLAPVLDVMPPGPAGSSLLLSWPTRPGCLGWRADCSDCGVRGGGSRVPRSQARDPSTNWWSQQGPRPTPSGIRTQNGAGWAEGPTAPHQGSRRPGLSGKEPGAPVGGIILPGRAEPGPGPRPAPGLPSPQGPSGPLQICPGHKLRRMGREGTRPEGPGAARMEGRG